MKKLFLILLAVLLVSCSTPDNSNAEQKETDYSSQYNATDDMFYASYNKRTDSISVTLISHTSISWGDVYTTINGSNGLVGKWEHISEYYKKELTLKNDGTYSFIRNNYYDKTVFRYNDKYEIYTENNVDYIRIFWSDKEYNLRYYCSPSYLVAESSGCPVL